MDWFRLPSAILSSSGPKYSLHRVTSDGHVVRVLLAHQECLLYGRVHWAGADLQIRGLGVGGGGAFGPQFGPKIRRGGGGVRGLTWIRHWSKLLFLMQSCCFSPALWSLLFTIQLFYSQNTETETNDNTRGKLDKATVFTDTTYEIKTCPSRRFFPFVWLKRDRYGTRT